MTTLIRWVGGENELVAGVMSGMWRLVNFYGDKLEVYMTNYMQVPR